LTLILLNHWYSSDPDINDEDTGKLIEDYLKKNDFRYLVLSQYTHLEGILISIEDVGTGDFPERTKEIEKICNLASFLFDKLDIEKRCLHFITGENMLNGNGQTEGSFRHIDPVIFTELTGIPAPDKFKPKTKEELFKFIKDMYSEDS
jgi:hypothetical protein